MSDKPRFPAEAAKEVARELCRLLKPVTQRLVVAGSLRRLKPQVGDVEILFIPQHGSGTRAGELIPERNINITEAVIAELLHLKVLDYRLSKTGAKTYGPKNKLLVHVASGIPVDLFSATERNWWNYLVCRTGNAEHNVKICQRAQELGYKWHPYGAGLTRNSDGMVVQIMSERHLFEFLNLEWKEPQQRS